MLVSVFEFLIYTYLLFCMYFFSLEGSLSSLIIFINSTVVCLNQLSSMQLVLTVSSGLLQIDKKKEKNHLKHIY